MEAYESKNALRLRVKFLEDELLKFRNPIEEKSPMSIDEAKEIVPITDIIDLLALQSYCESKAAMVGRAINSVNFLTQYFKVCEGRDVNIKVYNKKKAIDKTDALELTTQKVTV